MLTRIEVSAAAATLAFVLVLSGCSSAPPGSRERAVNDAWKDFCSGSYCEGYAGRIVSRTDDSLTVEINGNIRYIIYSVSGELGNYSVRMQPTGDHGRQKP